MYDLAAENELNLEALRARLGRMGDKTLLRLGTPQTFAGLTSKKGYTMISQNRQEPFYFCHYFSPSALVAFSRFPMPGTPLVFPLASELDGKVQFGPDVLCELAGFEAGSIVLTSVKNDIGLGPKVIEAIKMSQSRNMAIVLPNRRGRSHSTPYSLRASWIRYTPAGLSSGNRTSRISKLH